MNTCEKNATLIEQLRDKRGAQLEGYVRLSFCLEGIYVVTFFYDQKDGNSHYYETFQWESRYPEVRQKPVIHKFYVDAVARVQEELRRAIPQQAQQEAKNAI